MSDRENKIRADLARDQVRLMQDMEQKLYLQVKADNFLYSILDIFAEKSSSPQFIYQVDADYRPMDALEYRLFMEKLRYDVQHSGDISFRNFRIWKEMKRFEQEYKYAEKNNHLCIRDLRDFSETHNWSMEAYKEGDWHIARLGKTKEQDIFIVGQRLMTGKEFVHLFGKGKVIMKKIGWDKEQIDLFEDRFISAGCRHIAAQRPRLNDDTKERPRE